MGYQRRSHVLACVFIYVCACIVYVPQFCVNVAIMVIKVVLKLDEEWAVFIQARPIRSSYLVTRQAVKHIN